MKTFTRVVLLVLVVLVTARPVHAQTVGLADDSQAGVISVGAFVGREFDGRTDALLLGGDTRIRYWQINLEIDPRYVFRPFDNGSMQQFDVNVVTNYRLANPGRFRPYSGLGLAIHQLRFEDVETNSDVGLNLISGVRFAMRPGAAYEPFVSAQYTIMNEPANSFTLVVGASFSLR